MEHPLCDHPDEESEIENFCCDQRKNGQESFCCEKSLNLGKSLTCDFCVACRKTGVLKCYMCKEVRENHCKSYKASVYERHHEKTFESTLCSYKANSQKALQRHRKPHITSNIECKNENSFEYNVGYKAKNELALKDHKTTSGGINTLICKKKTLKTHEKRYNDCKASASELKDGKTFECTICNYKAKSRKALKRHRKTHVISNTLDFEGKDDKTLECNFGYKVKNERTLKDYQTKNGSVKTLVCEKKALETYEKRGKSYKASTSERQDEKFFECTICSYKAKSRRAFQRHRKTHIISNTMAFQDENKKALEYYFGYRVDKEQALKGHKTKNNSAKLLLCGNKSNKVNESVIGKKEAKNKLAKSKRKKIENTLTCKFCSYKTLSKEDLVSHQKTHNSAEILKCKYCGFIFSATDFSERHECIRSLGNKRINFAPFREKATSTKDVETNIGSHNASRFKCKDFPFDNDTQISLKLQSPKQKDMVKFKCTVCKYNGKSVEQLNSHMVKHSRNKKLKCHYCDYKCLKSEELELHLHTHKNVKCSQNILRNSKTSEDLSNRYRLNGEFGNEESLTSKEIEYRRYVLWNNYENKSTNEISRGAENKSTKTIEKPLLYFNSLTVVVGRKYIELRNIYRIFRCIFCSFTTLAKSSLKVHIIETHIKPKFLNCKFCSFKGTSKTCLRNHVKSHAINKSSCEFCGNLRFLPKVLQFNLSNSRTGSINFQGEQSICKCNNTLTSSRKTNCNKVKRIAGGKLNQDDQESIFCDYNSATNNNLRRHLSLIHSDTEIIDLSFDCRYCNYKSATPDQREHSKVHSNGNMIRFRFKQRKYKHRGLQELRKRKDNPTLKCVFCGFCNYDSKNSFSDHATIHVGQIFSYCSSS